MAPKNVFQQWKLCALLLLAITLSLISQQVSAQNEVAIGSATTKSNAILWLNGNGSQGLILPVVTSKAAVASPDPGMIVYDDSDDKLWYRSNNSWVEVGAGGGSTANLNLAIQGNQLSLRDGTGILSTVNIAGGAPTAGSFMVFQSGSWQAVNGGDVSITNGALQVTGMRGKAMAALPATAQVLVYDPTANSNNGGWVFQPFSAASGVTNVSGTAPISVANPTTTPVVSIANAGITNALLADNAVTTAKIQDGTITGSDIANTTITTDKLAQSGAAASQVLQWNGTNWVPNTLAAGGTVTQVSTGTGLTGGPITETGTVSIAPGGVSNTELADDAVSANKISDNAVTTAKINASAVDNTKLADNAVSTNKIADNAVTTAKINAAAVDNTKLADNSVNSAKIANGSVTGADIASATITGTNITNGTITTDKLAQSGAAANQVLQWNGTNWVPNTLAAGGTVTQVSTGTGLTGGPITETGTVSIAPGGVSNTELADDAVSANKISDNAVTTAKINASAVDNTKLADNAVSTNKIADNAVTSAKINAAAVDNTKLADNSVNSAKIANGSVTGADIASATITGTNITNGTITTDKLGQSGAAANQVLQWNGTNWVPNTLATGGTVTQVSTGTGLTGGPITETGTISIAAGGVGNTELADNAVSANKISDNAVTTAKINASAVDNTKLADNAVSTNKIADNAVTSAKINAAAVDNTKLADNAVNSAKIADGTITGTDIAATTVTGTNIANTTITANKLAQSGALVGQVLKWNGTNWVPQADDFGSVSIPVLTAGQLITNNGTNDVGVTMGGDATFSGTGALTIANNAITTAKIANTAVDATKLADNAVTNVKINAGAVDNTKLADNAVNSAKIADGSVTGTDIASATITGANITNGTITTDKLAQSGAAANQVLQWNGTNWVPGNALSATLNSGQILVGNAGNVATPATLSGDGTLTNTGVLTISNGAINSAKIADGSITGGDVAASTLTGSNIANATITADKLAQSGAADGEVLKWNGTNWVPQIDDTGTPLPALTAGQLITNNGTVNTGVTMSGDATFAGTGALTIANNAITTAKIANTAVDATKLADNAVTTAKINANAVDATKIADNAVTTAKIAAGAVDDTRLADNAVTTAKIADNAVTSAEIADGTITGADIANSTITANKLEQSGALNDQVLQWNGSNWVPATVGAGFSTLNTIPKGNGTTLVASQIFDNGTNVGIGTSSPGAKLDIIGSIKITDGTQAAGRVLTSDANGLASWQAAGAGTGWSLTGNGSIVDPTNFIGTTNDVAFNIRVNNVRAGRIESTVGGSGNAFFGYRSGLVNAGTNNTALGANSMDSNSSGSSNTAIGYNTMEGNTTGIENTAVGYQALKANTTAGLNTAVGKSALFVQNAAVGNTGNTAIGYHALYNNNPTDATDGKWNVALGYFAGEANTTGRDNTFVGASAQPSLGTLTNATAIGANAVVNASNKIRLGSTSVTVIEGQVAYTNASDKRLKNDIRELSIGLDFISKLKPVSYKMNNSDGRENWGFIAQEIEELVGTDKAVLTIGEDDMRTLGLRYTDFIAPMVKAMQEQQREIENLKSQLMEKDDKVNTLETSVNSMKDELENIKRTLGMEASLKPSQKQ